MLKLKTQLDIVK